MNEVVQAWTKGWSATKISHTLREGQIPKDRRIERIYNIIANEMHEDVNDIRFVSRKRYNRERRSK